MRIRICSALLFCSSLAQAGAVSDDRYFKLGEADDSTWYVERNSAFKRDTFGFVNVVIDYKNQHTPQSILMQLRYICTFTLQQQIAHQVPVSTAHSGAMLSGSVIDRHESNEWLFTPKDSLLGAAGNVACEGALAEMATPQSDTYLSDLLKKPAYRAAWKTMLRSGKPPAWLKEGGTQSPATSVGQYLVAETCKPHECPFGVFFVLFAPDGKQAWGLLLSGGDFNPDPNSDRTMIGQSKTWFGNPNDAIKTILELVAGRLGQQP